MTRRPAARSFYDYPAIYDAIHLADTSLEASVMLDIIARHGNGGLDILEPACGTGRLLEFLAQRGYAVTGYDVNPRVLAFARRRLKSRAKILKANMTRFRAKSSFDAAFSLIGTFRHLLTERAALQHLKLTAQALGPGGVYVVGLDLLDYGAVEPEEEGWSVIHRRRRLSHILMTLPPDGRRREQVINFITISSRRGDRVLQDQYWLRSYDWAQWKRLVAKSPFKLAAAYLQEGLRIKPGPKTRYALFVLKRKETDRAKMRRR